MKFYFLWICCSILLFSTTDSRCQNYADTYVPNAFVAQNRFVKAAPNFTGPPAFESVRNKLPIPVWANRKDVIACYWKAWELAFKNVHGITRENGFIQPYIDPAFNGNIFMWDTTFMALFGRYGHRAFNFQGSLDNFYHKQHSDGFICREISTVNGNELFNRFDPSSTGPNIMPWAEWEYYLNFNDLDRLTKAFPPLLAYYQWFRDHRTWPDGSYYSTGWGCGMDNQPRVPSEYHYEFSPAFMSWIDTSLQEIFAARILIAMAEKLNRMNDVAEIQKEVRFLKRFVQDNMWNDTTAFFHDRFRNGKLSDVKSIASYWALLAEAVPKDKLERFVSHLKNPKEFSRLHRVPTLSADHPSYKADGGYWRGGVWAPTSYMVLRGLSNYKQDSLAYEIAINHLNNVVQVHTATGTLWENYAPDSVKGMWRKDMVGWTGLVPISVLFEYVFGLRPNVPENTVVWDIRLLYEFGVKQYPLKRNGIVDFWCAKRKSKYDKPIIKVNSNIAFDLILVWAGGKSTIHVKSGRS